MVEFQRGKPSFHSFRINVYAKRVKTVCVMQVTSSGGGGLAGYNGESSSGDENVAPRTATVTSVPVSVEGPQCARLATFVTRFPGLTFSVFYLREVMTALTYVHQAQPRGLNQGPLPS